MRLRKAEVRKRVNGDLEFRSGRDGLTSYAGVELIGQFFRRIDFVSRIRSIIRKRLPQSDHGSDRIVMLLLTALLIGCRRVRHIEYLRRDPVIERVSGLSSLPSVRSVSRWLASMRSEGVEALSQVNEWVAAEGVREARPGRLTIDIDGSVISTGLLTEGAERGFNPHQRKVPSYYPITAYEAQSGMVLRVANRPGNVHDGKASVPFLRDLFEQIDRSVGKMTEEYRMDGAFFRADVLEAIEQRGAEYVIKVPFYPWLGLKQKVAGQKAWNRVDATVQCFETEHWIETWKRTVRIVIYRKRVAHETRKNFQLDLFDPNDGHYEYSAIASNRPVSGRALWWLMCGRGTHEKVYGELKHGFAFGSVVSQSYHGNSAWQVLSVLAFNLARRFQAATSAPTRTSNPKRRSLHLFESIQTLRFELLNRAGLLVRPSGRATLDLGTNRNVAERFERTARQLQTAA